MASATAQSADPVVHVAAESMLPAMDWLSVSPTRVVLPSGPGLSAVTLNISGEHLRHTVYERWLQAGVSFPAVSAQYGTACKPQLTEREANAFLAQSEHRN